jgi:hypothetical protein
MHIYLFTYPLRKSGICLNEDIGSGGSMKGEIMVTDTGKEVIYSEMYLVTPTSLRPAAKGLTGP